MSVRVLISVKETVGTHSTAPRWFWCGVDPCLLVVQVADFYSWAVDRRHPLTVDSYLHYAGEYPGALPVEDAVGRHHFDDTSSGNAVDRYELTLNGEQHGLRFTRHDLVAERRGPDEQRGPNEPDQTLTQANLYAAAAYCCEAIAADCERHIASNTAPTIPGGEPAMWRQRAERYVQRQQSTAVGAAAANLTARFRPGRFDNPFPAVEVAGVWMYAYIDSRGCLQVSVRLDEADEWLMTLRRTVPIRITVQGRQVYAAG